MTRSVKLQKNKNSSKNGTLTVIYLPWLCQPNHNCLISPRMHLVFENNWEVNSPGAVVSSCLLAVFIKDSFELKGKKGQYLASSFHPDFFTLEGTFSLSYVLLKSSL